MNGCCEFERVGFCELQFERFGLVKAGLISQGQLSIVKEVTHKDNSDFSLFNLKPKRFFKFLFFSLDCNSTIAGYNLLQQETCIIQEETDQNVTSVFKC